MPLNQNILIAFALLGAAATGCNMSPANKDSKNKKSDTVKVVKSKPVIDSEARAKEIKVAAHKKFVADSLRFPAIVKYLYNKDTAGKWPAFPQKAEGAILPYNRIIAFYGNLSSKKMGILGEIPKNQMIAKLRSEIKKWSKDSNLIHTIPAFDYIATSAQGAPGKDGKYRLHMPFKQVDTVVKWANEIGAIVFIDIQVGQSTIQAEVPRFEKYLAMPNVHLSIDPEFSMKTHKRPGSVIGTFDATDVNYCINYLANMVKEHHLPPKILVVHRFTQKMVTGYKNFVKKPEVQVIMHMDGWGNPELKIGTYKYIVTEPVEYTGFKLFYKNDAAKVHLKQEMQPEDVLKLSPRPVYIQYQ